MKNTLLLILIILSAYGLEAQSLSCCTMPANEQNRALAMNEEFAKSHLPPLPFVLQNGKGKMVTFKTSDGKTAHAYEVKSDKPTNKIIFVFHEWWGLNDYIKREAENLQTDLGDVDVYALDLYDGNVATASADAQKYMAGLKEERGKAIIHGALAYVGKDKKIVSIGWCMGGMWSLQSALLEGKEAVGCVMYYGMPESDIKKLKTLNCDVFGIFGTQDKFINPDVVKTFQESMKKAGKTLSVHNYDAVHAFANPSNPNYNKTFADEANELVIVYIKEKFK